MSPIFARLCTFETRMRVLFIHTTTSSTSSKKPFRFQTWHQYKSSPPLVKTKGYDFNDHLCTTCPQVSHWIASWTCVIGCSHMWQWSSFNVFDKGVGDKLEDEDVFANKLEVVRVVLFLHKPLGFSSKLLFKTRGGCGTSLPGKNTFAHESGCQTSCQST